MQERRSLLGEISLSERRNGTHCISRGASLRSMAVHPQLQQGRWKGRSQTQVDVCGLSRQRLEVLLITFTSQGSE